MLWGPVRDYVLFYWQRRTSDDSVYMGRTPEEAETNGNIYMPGDHTNGVAYFLLDKDRLYALLPALVAFNPLYRFFHKFEAPFPWPHLNGIVTYEDLFTFDSPRSYFSHDHDPVSWSIK